MNVKGILKNKKKQDILCVPYAFLILTQYDILQGYYCDKLPNLIAYQI